MVSGSVQDERMFSAMSIIRSDRRNRLKASHLTMCARLLKDVLLTESSVSAYTALMTNLLCLPAEKVSEQLKILLGSTCVSGYLSAN
jgi:hypothetical protein